MTQVGIMSMQRIFNYGSSLQAYGLRRLIEGLRADLEVSFVDYHPGTPLVAAADSERSPLTRNWARVRDAMGVKASPKDRLRFLEHKRRYGARYYSQIGVTSAPQFDVALDLQVIGSDEVFNCVQSNARVGYTRELFGHGARSKKIISYAASFGNTTLAKLDKFSVRTQVADDLAKFDALSVRDQNSANIVETLIGVRPLVHVDPVLAYPFMDSEPKIPAKRLHEKPYIVVYGYSGRLDDRENAVLRDYAATLGADILCFGGLQGCADRFVECSPFELLAYFRDAEAVVTDTFHGTIFSLINARPFATIIRPSIGQVYGNEEKLSYLLDRFGFSGHRVEDIEDVPRILDLERSGTDFESALALERRRSTDYLENVLSALS